MSILKSGKFNIETALTFALWVALTGLLVMAFDHRQLRLELQTLNAAPPETSPVFQPITVFPDFASIDDVERKKQHFFDFLELYIIAENSKVQEQREHLEAISDVVADGHTMSQRERQFVKELAGTYEVETKGLRDQQLLFELLARVDTIPLSLALAQAANESAWGTSRFALEANNIFGQWCYEEGCGVVPNNRSRDATHEVKSFESIEKAVAAYIHNINTHPGYKHLRKLRAQMRRQQGNLDPLVLAYGLTEYSERGEHYVDEVQTIIKQNALTNRDNI